ncbi:MAG: helix-turn-helix domain-containing protein, partial [Lachnospiraceae bacterium]|nr:helix-turn-helix domain-containing protein [Lachnospiraceae bacterium]
MKKFSGKALAGLVSGNRKSLKMSQQELADKTGINRAMISRIEKEEYIPSVPQLEALAGALGFEAVDVFKKASAAKDEKKVGPLNIAVAGTGYVGLSIATLLAQNNHVTAVD